VLPYIFEVRLSLLLPVRVGENAPGLLQALSIVASTFLQGYGEQRLKLFQRQDYILH
jgi:hypothetical protein